MVRANPPNVLAHLATDDIGLRLLWAGRWWLIHRASYRTVETKRKVRRDGRAEGKSENPSALTRNKNPWGLCHGLSRRISSTAVAHRRFRELVNTLARPPKQKGQAEARPKCNVAEALVARFDQIEREGIW